jgi:hypothetical protein
MNPGATEEAGKAVGSFFDIMKGIPMVLALVVMNFGMLGYLLWSGKEIISVAHESHKETRELLSSCIERLQRP